MSSLSLRADIERWPLTTPFRITGYTFDVIEVLLVTVARDGHVGRGEATGIYYKNDKPEGMIRQIEALRTTIERASAGMRCRTFFRPAVRAMRSIVRYGIWMPSCSACMPGRSRSSMSRSRC